MEHHQPTSMIDTGSKTRMEPAGPTRPMSYDALSMAAPSRMSSRTVRQDGRHAGGIKLYHCLEREATGCKCGGLADRRGRHKSEVSPDEKLTLIPCVGAATCPACKQCKYRIHSLMQPHIHRPA